MVTAQEIPISETIFFWPMGWYIYSSAKVDATNESLPF